MNDELQRYIYTRLFLFGMLCLSQRSCVILNIQNTTTLIVISEFTEAVSV